jgi:arylformamidase
MNVLELEYNNRLRLPHAAATIEKWSAQASAYRERCVAEGRAEIGLRYGATPGQTIDMFLPKRDTAKHVCVFVHGGYWQLFNPSFFSHVAEGANANGTPMALIGYDLCPAVGIETIIKQVRAGCTFIAQRYRRRIVMSGHSAGGHLTAAMMSVDWANVDGFESNIIAAGIAISGVFELTPLLRTSLNEKLLLDENSALKLSPVRWQPLPRTMLDAWVGANESSEFQRQSREFAANWKEAGADTKLVSIADADHFAAIAPLSDPDSNLTQRLIDLASGKR